MDSRPARLRDGCAPWAGPAARPSHPCTGSSRFSENTTSTRAWGSQPCNFQAMPSACRAISSRALLRINAVSLDILFVADVADGVGVRIVVLQVRAFAGIGIGEDYFRPDFDSACGWLRRRDRPVRRARRRRVRLPARRFRVRCRDKRSPRFRAGAPRPADRPVARVPGNSSATTCGRSRKMARRTSMANSRRPGTTGK